MKIDLITSSKDGSEIYLYIALDAAWTGDGAQLQAVQDKVNGYLEFILDGQMAKQYPALKGKKVKIRLSCTGIESFGESDFLSDLEKVVLGYGIEMELYNDGRVIRPERHGR